MQQKGCGTLYLCATPIGNLEDITLRVLRVLKEVQLIAAEDTRHSRKLLQYYDIHTPLTSYHDHTKDAKQQSLIERLLSGDSIALISDAGTPAISDPGYELVKEAIAHDILVVPLPGASAVLSALTISGLPTDEFTFRGFLPRSGTKRRDKLREIAEARQTQIIYEAPHRLNATLRDLAELFGERNMAACRELTKKFEQAVRGTVKQVGEHFKQYKPQGEFVLVLEGCLEENASHQQQGDPESLLKELMANGINKKEAIKMTASRLGLSKREVYQLAIAMTNE